MTMLNINAIKIEIFTTIGEFGGEYYFQKGLNIIKGKNTAGKSTLFQTILYALGMEEMLGGRNEKTMQSAVRDSVEFPKEKFHTITQSRVFLEISNGNEIITLQRSIKSSISSKLIRIYNNGIITQKNAPASFTDTWIHDSGGAKNTTYGFHNVLEKFLNWNLPDVTFSQGDFKKLYIQTIFPAFVIEQKGGWADFLATIPYFGIRNADSRAVEFLLNLEVSKNEQKRQLIRDKKNNVSLRWRTQFENLHYNARRGNVEISGLPSSPEIISALTPINLYILHDNIRKLLKNYIQELQNELNKLESKPIVKTGETVSKNNDKLIERQNKLEQLSIKWEFLNRKLRIEKDKVDQYQKQLVEVREELRQNKDVKKIYNLGGEAHLNTSQSICPTCNQEVQDSLFMPVVHLTPMNIDENIRYVEAQEKMILTYIEFERKSISSDERLATSMYSDLNDIRKEIRDLKKELISDERLPSVAELEKKILLKNKVEFYMKFIEELNDLINNFQLLSDEWEILIQEEEKIPKEFLTKNDLNKVFELERNFKNLLQIFGYTSKFRDSISISKEGEKRFLLPVVSSEGTTYSIRFDSSGSDLIRALWSYYCSLLKVGLKYQTNHPNLLMLDEPAQQEVANSSFNELLKEVQTYKNAQVLIFASFHQSDSDYEEMVKGVSNFNLINIDTRSIKPINTNNFSFLSENTDEIV